MLFHYQRLINNRFKQEKTYILMVNYQEGKIYKLVGSGLTYYGSTTQRLCERKAGHKRLDCKSKILFEKGDVDIVLVEKYPCNSKEELHSRERYYIENNECINKNIPNRPRKEYYRIYIEQNKDNLKDKKKEYRENNKDKIKEKNKKYREQNRKKESDRLKKWRDKNIEKYREKRNIRQRLYRLHKKIDDIFNK
jgi:hypothetical protein